MSDALPHGWMSSTLGAIRVDSSSNIDPTKYPAETFELYSIPAYPGGRPEVVTGSEVGSTKKSLEPGTVVVSKINPRINRVWVVGDRAAHRQIGSSEWIPFFPIEGIEPKYLAYYLQQDRFRNYLAANVSGVGGSLMRVKPSTVDPFPLVLAPLCEQHRIVSAIESYLTRLDDAVATLERVQRNLKRYRASVLKAAVEGRLIPTEAELAHAAGRDYEPASVLLGRILAERRRRWEEAELMKMKAKGKATKDDRWKAKYKEPVAPDTSELPELPGGWCWASVDQICSHIVDCPHSTPKWANDGYICVRTTEFLPGRLVLDRVRFVSRSIFEERIQRLRPEAGDILYSREGGILGIACQVPPGVELCLGQRMLLMRVGTKSGARYLMHILNGPMVLSRVRELTGGSASPHLNVSDIRNFPVSLPPEAELLRIADTIDDVLSVADSTIADVGAYFARLARLRQSILKWAFEGRLVDQDPTDESASALLERIRAERASATDKPARRPRRTKARTPKL